MLRISAYSSKQLQAVILGLRTVDRDTRAQIRKETRTIVGPAWQQAVHGQARTRLEQRVLGATARVQVSDQNVQLKAASVGRALPGGLLPSRDWAGVEFGADRDRVTTYAATSRRGRAVNVKRHTTRQLRTRNVKGHVVYPAAAEVIPRIAALWVQTVVRGLHDALEGR